jgi:hypothetical protein
VKAEFDRQGRLDQQAEPTRTDQPRVRSDGQYPRVGGVDSQAIACGFDAVRCNEVDEAARAHRQEVLVLARRKQLDGVSSLISRGATTDVSQPARAAYDKFAWAPNSLRSR